MLAYGMIIKKSNTRNRIRVCKSTNVTTIQRYDFIKIQFYNRTIRYSGHSYDSNGRQKNRTHTHSYTPLERRRSYLLWCVWCPEEHLLPSAITIIDNKNRHATRISSVRYTNVFRSDRNTADTRMFMANVHCPTFFACYAAVWYKFNCGMVIKCKYTNWNRVKSSIRSRRTERHVEYPCWWLRHTVERREAMS